MEALFWLGEWPDLFRRVAEYLKNANDRGDLYGATYMRTRIVPMQLLAAGRPAEARDEARAGIERWSVRGFHLQHSYELTSQLYADLYLGDAHAGARRIADRWTAFSRSLLLQIQCVRAEAVFLRGTVALAVGDTAGLKEAAKLASRLEHERVAYAVVFGRVLGAGVAAARGDRASAITGFEDAERRALDQELTMVALACRRRRGQLLGTTDGAALVDAADEAMRGLQVVDPERMARVWAPTTSP